MAQEVRGGFSGHPHFGAFLPRHTFISKPSMTDLFMQSASKASENEQNCEMIKVGKFCLASTNRLEDMAREVRGGFSGYSHFGPFLLRHNCVSKPTMNYLFMGSISKWS